MKWINHGWTFEEELSKAWVYSQKEVASELSTTDVLEKKKINVVGVHGRLTDNQKYNLSCLDIGVNCIIQISPEARAREFSEITV